MQQSFVFTSERMAVDEAGEVVVVVGGECTMQVEENTQTTGQ